MKTTYKLLGLHWDGMPMPSREIKATTEHDAWNCIPTSVLFGAKTLEEADALIDSLDGCGKVVVLDDCRPITPGSVVQGFYRKRLLQACGHVQRRLPGAEIMLSDSSESPSASSGSRRGRYTPIDSLLRFFQIADEYSAYLEGAGVSLNNDGFPLLDSPRFLDEWPDQVVTFKYRTSSLVEDESRTALCFFAPDQQIYPRLAKVFDELEEYRKYLGIVMIDTTITRDMDEEWQAATMLLNQLFMAVLAVNGIKVMANLRSGSPGTEAHLRSVPEGVMWASGRLGCKRLEGEADFDYLAKVLSVSPSKLLLYGPPDKNAEAQLEVMGVDYRRYPDVHAQYDARKRARKQHAA